MIQDVRSPSIGQIMALAGCNFLFFDMEHGPFNLETIADMVRVTRLAGVTPLVRVPDAEYHLMCRPPGRAHHRVYHVSIPGQARVFREQRA
jgi:2-dehydro-3-deoxyglucarate aldolase/4-hydroxy-2-oxoheptanedioate aldolase